MLGGAALFGVGWGLSGFCPGPAVAALVPALTSGLTPVFVFFVAMLCGLALYARFFERPERGVMEEKPPKGAESRVV